MKYVFLSSLLFSISTIATASEQCAKTSFCYDACKAHCGSLSVTSCRSTAAGVVVSCNNGPIKTIQPKASSEPTKRR